MIAIRALPRESSQTELGSARLIYTRNATKPLLFSSQICHFMRLALQNYAHKKLCIFSFTFFHYKTEKTRREEFLDVSASLEIALAQVFFFQ